MGTSEATTPPGGRTPGESELVGARALREWLTGERGDYSRVFLLDSGDAAEAAERVAGPDDVILVPEGTVPSAGRARTIGYSGALEEVGDELFLGERGVEVQDYIAAAFVHIIGPTAVRFFDSSSWQAFLDDADLARRTGIFPAALLDPRVILASRHAIAAPEELDTPNAVRVHGDGVVRIGIQGAVVGSIGDLPAVLEKALPRAAALGGITRGDDIPGDDDLGDDIAGALTGREWIARYLDAAELMKMLRLANGEAKIDGFGWSAHGDDVADAEPESGDPFLLETADGFLLADIRTLRRQLLPPLTAYVVAATQTSRTFDQAAGRVARAFDVPAAHARDLCVDAVSALGIHLGRRVDGPRARAATS